MESRKRKVQFAEPVEEKPEPSRFKTDLQPDSDEEENDIENKTEDENDVLDDDDIEGQEDETIRFDGDIALTPFNLKDELEEGHFDKQGNYIANKSDADITDGWLDSVDWGRVSVYKDPEAVSRGDAVVDEDMDDDDDDDDDDEMKEKADTSEMIEQMVVILKPGETVLRCLRRLGGSQKKRLSTAERWKKKKQASAAAEECSVEEAENKANLLKLTGLADLCLQAGDFQIYEKTFEQLTYELRSQQEAKKAHPVASQFEDAIVSEPSQPGEVDDDDDELEAAFKASQQTNQSEAPTNQNAAPPPNQNAAPPPTEASDTDMNTKASDMNTEAEEPPTKKAKAADEDVTVTPKEISLSDNIQWMYRSSVDAMAELVGPFTSEQMLAWSEDGTFEGMDGGGAMCCKVGSEGTFYHSKRIDFELYT